MSRDELDLAIKGDLVLPHGIAKDAAVGVQNGVITGLYSTAETPSAKETVDAGGLLVFPGVVDSHVHSYSVPDGEGFEHSTAAAAAGGVTTFVEMPYDAGNPTTNPETLQEKIQRVKRLAIVDIALLATLKKEGPLDVIAPMVELGACGFKLSLFETDPDRFPRIPDGILWKALPLISAHGVPVGFHAENDEIIFRLIDEYRKEGKTYPKAHCETRPPISETISVLKLLEFAYWTRSRLHIYHVSHPRSIHLLQRFREDGVDVTTETCPHYLLFHEDDMDRLKAFTKINPPIRKREAMEEMWELLKSGHIDMVTSDHAPWGLDKKQASNIFENSSGAPGLETIFPLLYSEGVVKRGLAPVRLAQMLSEQPARRFNLYPRKGHISLGADADFAILDPSCRWAIRGSEMRTSAKWTPYEGLMVQGKVVRTILRGKTVYDGKEVTATAGDGNFIPAGKG
ncbi:MAG: dihydroorotase [Deltaproteobacteria bacterium]|nr:dihydroorotase [Deltaproteobacteria bacterium]